MSTPVAKKVLGGGDELPIPSFCERFKSGFFELCNKVATAFATFKEKYLSCRSDSSTDNAERKHRNYWQHDYLHTDSGSACEGMPRSNSNISLTLMERIDED